MGTYPDSRIHDFLFLSTPSQERIFIFLRRYHVQLREVLPDGGEVVQGL